MRGERTWLRIRQAQQAESSCLLNAARCQSSPVKMLPLVPVRRDPSLSQLMPAIATEALLGRSSWHVLALWRDVTVDLRRSLSVVTPATRLIDAAVVTLRRVSVRNEQIRSTCGLDCPARPGNQTREWNGVARPADEAVKVEDAFAPRRGGLSENARGDTKAAEIIAVKGADHPAAVFAPSRVVELKDERSCGLRLSGSELKRRGRN